MGDRLSRRLLVLRSIALGGTGMTLTACVPPPAYAPQPVYVPRGTGLTEVPPSHCLTPSSTVGGLTRPASRDASGLVAGPTRPPVTPIRIEARLQLRKK